MATTASQSWAPRCVLVLQGGGALGSFQAGVYETLAAEHREPEWVTGISIGAINAALIAGNPPERRVERLRAFWELICSTPQAGPLTPEQGLPRTLFNVASANMIAAFGATGFFAPRVGGPLAALPGTPEALSFYDTSPLKKTLEELIDFDLINSKATRLSVGAVDIVRGNTVVFDNTERKIGPEHIMASGALPPGFPYVMIDGVAYWDGELVSNTPLQFVLDQQTPDPLVIFQVDLFNAAGAMPNNLIEADERERDIRFSSRTRMNTDAAARLHKAKMALRNLLDRLPPELKTDLNVELLEDIVRANAAIRIVQLIYRARPYEGRSKDYEFSRPTMREHWASGLADALYTVRAYRAQIDTPADGVQTLDAGRSASEMEVAL